MRTFTLVLCLTLLTAGMTHADINTFIENVNISARADIGGYKTRLEARFGTSASQLEVVLRSVECPADAAIVLWLGEQVHQPVETVLSVYHSHKSQGWGAMAKKLGIKPGSPAFHALKNGNLGFAWDDRGHKSNSHHRGKEQGKKSRQT